METDINAITLTESEGVYTITGVNYTNTDKTVDILLNGTVICSFTIEGVHPVEKVFTSIDITDGGTYASTYFVTPRHFTITNLEESDTVAMTTDIPGLNLTESEGVYTVAGVNVDETAQTVSITLNGNAVCTFTIEGRTP